MGDERTKELAINELRNRFDHAALACSHYPLSDALSVVRGLRRAIWYYLERAAIAQERA